MKDLICIGLLFLSVIICNGQNKLQESLDRYDYKTAIAIIDSLTAKICTDSTSIAENRETVIELALQKARCLRQVCGADLYAVGAAAPRAAARGF